MKLKYDFVITEIDDRYVAIPAGEGADDFNGVIHLNGTAREIMELLLENKNCEEIIKSLSEKYNEASPDEIASAVNTFIGTLKNEALLID